METLKTIIEAIKIFIIAYKYVTDKIDDYQFSAGMKSIRSNYKEYKDATNIEERLKAGKKLEDNFKKYTDS